MIAGHASDGQQAIAQTSSLEPDVVLMDIQMPNTDGLAALEQITKEQPEATVLILTAYGDPDYVDKAIENGASGYILKNDSPSTIAKAISDALDGGTPVSSAVNTTLWKRQRNNIPLTDRETQILQLAVADYNDQEISQALYISARTVRNNWSNITTKLGVKDKWGAVAKGLDLKIVKLGS